MSKLYDPEIVEACVMADVRKAESMMGSFQMVESNEIIESLGSNLISTYKKLYNLNRKYNALKKNYENVAV